MSKRSSISRARCYDNGGSTSLASMYTPSNAAQPLNPAALPQYTPVQPTSTGILPSGLMSTPQVGSFNLDPTTGALSGSSQTALQNLAQRGLTIQQPASSASASGAGAGAVTNPGTADIFDAQSGANFGGGGGNANGGAVPHLADGGPPSWVERADIHGMGGDHPAGLIASPVGGRTDHLPMHVGSGSYVVPADIVSGAGQGNTLAGAHVMDQMMAAGPYGTKLPNLRLHGNLPKPPHPPRLARGGDVPGPGRVPVIVAGGEYLCSPADVAHLVEGGDVKKGHAMLDEAVKRWRGQIVKHTRNLPGPVKS